MRDDPRKHPGFTPHSDDGVIGRIYIERDDAALPASCERCISGGGRYVIRQFADAAYARRLCQSCIDTELTIEQFDTGRSLVRQQDELLHAERAWPPERLAEHADLLDIWWTGAPRPPFIDAFIRKYQRD